MRLTALNIRVSYAMAKIYTRFQLPGHRAQLQYALAAAAEYARRAARDAGVGITPACPLLFVDESGLVEAWSIGLTRFPGGWDGTGDYVPWWMNTPGVKALPPGAVLPAVAGIDIKVEEYKHAEVK